MTLLRDGLGSAGYRVLTFNYPYTERGAKTPDRGERLIACHMGAAEFFRPLVARLFMAGRSMGGRMATMLVAEGEPADGIVLYSYPLHPAGEPDKLRIDHLPKVPAPMLFVQGTRDPLSRMDLFERHIASLPNAQVELLEGAGHGSRGGGWTAETITERYVSATRAWIDGLSSGAR